MPTPQQLFWVPDFHVVTHTLTPDPPYLLTSLCWQVYPATHLIHWAAVCEPTVVTVPVSYNPDRLGPCSQVLVAPGMNIECDVIMPSPRSGQVAGESKLDQH